jgi:hypothetical protein
MGNESASGPAWDANLARALVGKVLLVGLTIESAGATAPQQHQFYGTVISADRRKGIALSLLGNRSGESYNLPPDTRAVQVAAAGTYRLRATGEVVVDPDFTAAFSVSRPAPA